MQLVVVALRNVHQALGIAGDSVAPVLAVLHACSASAVKESLTLFYGARGGGSGGEGSKGGNDGEELHCGGCDGGCNGGNWY
jgi:hypothetical protein